MPYENVYRNPQGRLRLPFADLPLLLHVHKVHISTQERPALENMFQFLSSVMILAGRLRSHLSRYEEDTWVNVPFNVLFLDTQAVVLFLRQFMEDVALVVRAVLTPGVRRQMPAGFTTWQQGFVSQVPDVMSRSLQSFPKSIHFASSSS